MSQARVTRQLAQHAWPAWPLWPTRDLTYIWVEEAAKDELNRWGDETAADWLVTASTCLETGRA